VASVEFGTDTPEAEAVVLLWLLADRVLDNANAPLFLEIWSFAENLILKIFGEVIFGHMAAGIAMTARLIYCRSQLVDKNWLPD
jgi:uncharacterized integral membrane protein